MVMCVNAFVQVFVNLILTMMYMAVEENHM